MSEVARTPAVVLALGNPLMGDDGLGATVLERLRAWDWGPDVALVDGETWGLRLLPLVEDADRLLVVDAIDIGAPPGTLVSLDAGELPHRLNTALSPHQVGLQHVLALAELRGAYPARLAAIGAQPERVVFGEPLSPAVARTVDAVLAAAVEQLVAWGYAPRSLAGDGGVLLANGQGEGCRRGAGPMVGSPTASH